MAKRHSTPCETVRTRVYRLHTRGLRAVSRSPVHAVLRRATPHSDGDRNKRPPSKSPPQQQTRHTTPLLDTRSGVFGIARALAPRFPARHFGMRKIPRYDISTIHRKRMGRGP
jgi:hypothetical protein